MSAECWKAVLRKVLQCFGRSPCGSFVGIRPRLPSIRFKECCPILAEDMDSAQYPWETVHGNGCSVVLSERWHTFYRSGKWEYVASMGAQFMDVDWKPAYQGKGNAVHVYSPNHHSKQGCWAQRIGRWCLGRCPDESCPSGVCWANNFRRRLLDPDFDPKIMLQIWEGDDVNMLGPGQSEELAMALDVGVSIYRCLVKFPHSGSAVLYVEKANSDELMFIFPGLRIQPQRKRALTPFRQEHRFSIRAYSMDGTYHIIDGLSPEVLLHDVRGRLSRLLQEDKFYLCMGERLFQGNHMSQQIGALGIRADSCLTVVQCGESYRERQCVHQMRQLTRWSTDSQCKNCQWICYNCDMAWGEDCDKCGGRSSWNGGSIARYCLWCPGNVAYDIHRNCCFKDIHHAHYGPCLCKCPRCGLERDSDPTIMPQMRALMKQGWCFGGRLPKPGAIALTLSVMIKHQLGGESVWKTSELHCPWCPGYEEYREGRCSSCGFELEGELKSMPPIRALVKHVQQYFPQRR